MSLFERMLAGGIIPPNDPEISQLWEGVAKTMQLTARLNSATNIADIRHILSEITGRQIPESTTVFIPFHTNYGKHIQIGANVFINHACSFLDLGGIIIEDHVLIGPRVNITTENHPTDPQQRKSLDLKKVHIKKNAWIGAGATILPGVTIGENSIVAAGAVVTKSIPDNWIAGGVPAKLIKPVTTERSGSE